MSRAIAIDSNALTYLLDAHQDGYDPSTDLQLGADRLAMVRTLFYTDRLLWVSPTVEAEYKEIRNLERHDLHRRMAQYVLEDQPLRVDGALLDARARVLELSHKGRADCLIVAEAEFAKLDVLLSCDNDLIRDLSGKSTLNILRPAEYWRGLGIAPVRPLKEPMAGHPLFEKTWWRIGDA